MSKRESHSDANQNVSLAMVTRPIEIQNYEKSHEGQFDLEDEDLGLELEADSRGGTQKFDLGTFSSPNGGQSSEGWIDPSSAKQRDDLKDAGAEDENPMEAKLRRM